MIGKEWIVWLFVGVLSLAGVWWVDQRAFGRGVHSRDAEVAAITTQVAQAAVALNQCKSSTAAAKAKGDAQKAMADAALDAAVSADKGRSHDLVRAVDKLARVSKTDQCKAAAETELCASMASY